MACIGPKSSLAGGLGGFSIKYPNGAKLKAPQNETVEPKEVKQNSIETNFLGNDVNLKGIKLER